MRGRWTESGRGREEEEETERKVEKGISLSRDGETENPRTEALKERSVGGGADLRQRIKGGVKCRSD